MTPGIMGPGAEVTVRGNTMTVVRRIQERRRQAAE